MANQNCTEDSIELQHAPGNKPSLPHFRLKIILYLAHSDEAKKAYLPGYKRIIKWLTFWTKVYTHGNAVYHNISVLF